MYDEPGVTVGILTCGQPAHTVRCLESLCAQTSELPVRRVVLDNGLRDGDRQRVRAAAQAWGCEWLTGDVPGGPHLGIVRRNDIWRITQTQYAGFWDNDIELSPDVLLADVAYLDQHPEVALVGNLLLRPDGRIDCAGTRVPRGECRGEHLGHGDLPGPPWDQVRRVPWLGNGVARTAALHEAGLYDERCAPMGCEDLLLGCRLRALGYEIHLLPYPTVVHDAHQSTGGMKIDWQQKFALVRAEYGEQEARGEWESEVV